MTTWDYQTSVLFSLWTYKVIICLLLATPNMGCGVINDSVLVNGCEPVFEQGMCWCSERTLLFLL